MWYSTRKPFPYVVVYTFGEFRWGGLDAAGGILTKGPILIVLEFCF